MSKKYTQPGSRFSDFAIDGEAVSENSLRGQTTKLKQSRYPVYLGIDPGTSLIGYGVVAETPKGFSCIDYGTITNKNSDRYVVLKDACEAISELVRIHKPTAVGIEKLFFFKNQKTVMSVSEMRGGILLTLAQAIIPIYEFTPLQVKRAICNYGMADKKQVQRMVRDLLGLASEIRPDDAADALALAICCSTSYSGR